MNTKDKSLKAAADKLEKINTELDKIINANNSAMATHEAQMKEAQAVIDAANTAIVDATEAGDAAAYHKAKDKLREAQDNYELHKIVFDRKRTDKLTGKESATSYKNSIKEIAAEQQKQCAKKIYDLLTEAIELNEDYKAIVDICNAMLRKIDFDIMKTDRMMAEEVINSLTYAFRITGIDDLKRL